MYSTWNSWYIINILCNLRSQLMFFSWDYWAFSPSPVVFWAEQALCDLFLLRKKKPFQVLSRSSKSSHPRGLYKGALSGYTAAKMLLVRSRYQSVGLFAFWLSIVKFVFPHLWTALWIKWSGIYVNNLLKQKRDPMRKKYWLDVGAGWVRIRNKQERGWVATGSLIRQHAYQS